ncbi:MAG: peptidylprolyl isomerase [Clostridia bacterium]|nr:peptidylprolyl isomerase [Clostridia bacterium]
MKRCLTGLLALIMCLGALMSMISCSDGTLYTVEPTEKEKRIVGYVGGYEVYYDEIYYLTMNYKYQYGLKYGEEIWSELSTAQFYSADLQNDVIESLMINYAALALAKDYGVTLDSEKVKEYVSARMEDMADNIKNMLIASYSGKDQSYSPDQNEINDEYVSQLKSAYLTDRYVRFLYGVDGCVDQLVKKYIASGKISDDDEAVEQYIYDNFRRTLHIYIKNDVGESIEENRAKAQMILDEIDSGRKTFVEMMEHSEDFNTVSTNGYYFCRGEMTDAYEEVAYSLDVDEYSGIVTDETGFYIIKRYAIDEDYVYDNFNTLKTQYQYAVVNDDIADKAESLKFEYTEFGKGFEFWTLK